MLTRHYNARDILNPGEALVDGMFSDLIYSDLNWHVLYGLLLTRNRAHITGRGEVDFILICEFGILVIEVKGGFISYRNGRLYQRGINREEEKEIDPFNQVRGNCGTINSVLKGYLPVDVFAGEAVVFPESPFTYSGESFRHYWHQKSSRPFCQFLEQTLKDQSHSLVFEKLKKGQILQVVQKLIPEVNWQKRGEQLQHARQETEKRNRNNYTILKGLQGNRRLLIEGPPGSGKSTFAQQFILDRVEKEGVRVLYLCWNKFLAIHTQQWFVENEISENVRAVSFFDYINELWAIHPLTPKQLSYNDVPQLYAHTEQIVGDLQSVLMLDTFDLIVIDEAQDLFDKGIELVMDKQLQGGKNGIKQGNYIVFYDSLQAFDKGTDTVMYQLVYYTIREASAHYRLQDHFRTLEGSGIANFLDDSIRGAIDFNKTYGGDMVIRTFATNKDCIAIIKTTIRTLSSVEKVNMEDIVLLFSSNLVSGNSSVKGDKPLDGLLLHDEAFEKIEDENLIHPSQKIRYTTVLKYKGLEKDVVVLVIKDLFNEKIKTFYQMYIGASRAKAKVILLIDENSVQLAKRQMVAVETMVVKEVMLD